MNAAEQIKENIAKLEEALLASNPLMPGMLRTIHTALRNDPENVTTLSDEEVGVIVRGLMKQTQTVIAAEVAASKPKKALKNLDLMDL